jgi:cysteinyl-tRNA synthetase
MRKGSQSALLNRQLSQSRETKELDREGIERLCDELHCVQALHALIELEQQKRRGKKNKNKKKQTLKLFESRSPSIHFPHFSIIFSEWYHNAKEKTK